MELWSDGNTQRGTANGWTPVDNWGDQVDADRVNKEAVRDLGLADAPRKIVGSAERFASLSEHPIQFR